jgi:signal transduction histidine kinase
MTSPLASAAITRADRAAGIIRGLPRASRTGLGRGLRRARSSWTGIAWVMFAAGNLAAMRLLPRWQTVPFLAIWVSLTLIYGFRLWRLQTAVLILAAVTVATGGIIAVQVIEGQQDADYLAEVPLVALMFLVMAWHGRRRPAAMEAPQRVSADNLLLLEQQRLFLLDASHELGTPITVALGHAELIEQAAAGTQASDDAHVIVAELRRLRRLADRTLLLASAGNPGFLDLAPVAVDSILLEALDRWGHMPRRWRLGEMADATALADRDRLAVALDALLENAVAHTGTGDHIELSARIEGGQVILAVADSGCGIGKADLERIFGRFAQARPYRGRAPGGSGLGLPVAQAIAEVHDGSVRVRSTAGRGSTFELVIPASRAAPGEPGSPASGLGRTPAPRAKRHRRQLAPGTPE